MFDHVGLKVADLRASARFYRAALAPLGHVPGSAGDDYAGFGPGGLVEDLKLGMGMLAHHHSAFKRIAVVSDKDWVAHAMHAFAWMVPGELRIFGLDDLDAAKEWAAG